MDRCVRRPSGFNCKTYATLSSGVVSSTNNNEDSDYTVNMRRVICFFPAYKLHLGFGFAPFYC